MHFKCEDLMSQLSVKTPLWTKIRFSIKDTETNTQSKVEENLQVQRGQSESC